MATQIFEKLCRKCATVKPFAEFSKQAGRKYGLASTCKVCRAVVKKVWKDANQNKWKASDRAWEEKNREKRNKEKRDYRAANPLTVRATWNRWRDRNPLANKAVDMVNNAIKSGKLSKPCLCQFCGGYSDIEGHHKDYSKPLDVQWLCVPCHSKEHRVWLA